MYNVSSTLLFFVLLLSMLAALELGFRLGRRKHESATNTARDHVDRIQASLLGMLALLIGFTFSLSLQRFDSRSEALVAEANALGTAYLRASLLPEVVRDKTLNGIRKLIDIRANATRVDLAHETELARLRLAADSQVSELWLLTQRAVDAEKNPVTTGLFVQALNDAIDASARNDAELARHVPDPIVYLLYATFLISAGIVGYASGLAAQRPMAVTHVFIVLLAILASVVIDLDRPRRGFIEVDRSTFEALQASIDEDRQRAR